MKKNNNLTTKDTYTAQELFDFLYERDAIYEEELYGIEDELIFLCNSKLDEEEFEKISNELLTYQRQLEAVHDELNYFMSCLDGTVEMYYT